MEVVTVLERWEGRIGKVLDAMGWEKTALEIIADYERRYP